MGKTIKGFGVRGQDRAQIRKDLTGTYKGYKWFVMGDGNRRFRWSLGPMGGHVQGPKATLADAVKALQRAYRTISRLRNLFGEKAVKRAANELEILLKWEQAAAEGRISVKVKTAKDDEMVYTVKVKKGTP